MKLESVIFLICGAFLAVASAVYLPVSEFEPAGSAALILSACLCLMVGGYFWFISRRIDARPEDRTDGEIIEGAGELGFFAPASYFPFGLACAIAVVGFGVSFWYPWLMGLGVVLVLGMVIGLQYEFHTGQNTEDHESANDHNVERV